MLFALKDFCSKPLKEMGLQVTDWFDFRSWAFLVTLVLMEKTSLCIVHIHTQESLGEKTAQKLPWDVLSLRGMMGLFARLVSTNTAGGRGEEI